MRILAIIPARGGSKGVPRKNIKVLNGKPLMKYTIDTAKELDGITDVFFSSEDPEMISYAKQIGVDVPFSRPKHLATDTAGTLEVLQHTVLELAKMDRHYDAVCLLQVTYPFRKLDDVAHAIEKFASGNYDSLVTVKEVPHEYNPHWVFTERKEGEIAIATGEDEIIKRRQDLPPAFIRDGSVYLTKIDTLLEDNSLYGNKIGYHISEPGRYVNIDTMSDWNDAVILAEKLYGKCAE